MSAKDRFNGPWLSWLLLFITYATYGKLIKHDGASPLIWALSAGFAVVLAGILTVLWPWCRRILLWGFQSDFGYLIMALTIATLAVAAVTQFHLFVYGAMLVAASLLARVDTLAIKVNRVSAFLILSLLSLLGLGMSWWLAK